MHAGCAWRSVIGHPAVIAWVILFLSFRARVGESTAKAIIASATKGPNRTRTSHSRMKGPIIIGDTQENSLAWTVDTVCRRCVFAPSSDEQARKHTA